MYRKGYAFERDLKLLLESQGWRVIRSGGSKKPDLVAARKGKIIVIECKASTKNSVYIDEEELEELIDVAAEFNAAPTFALKVKNKGWSFVPANLAKRTGKSFVISSEDGRKNIY